MPAYLWPGPLLFPTSASRNVWDSASYVKPTIFSVFMGSADFQSDQGPHLHPASRTQDPRGNASASLTSGSLYSIGFTHDVPYLFDVGLRSRPRLLRVRKRQFDLLLCIDRSGETPMSCMIAIGLYRSSEARNQDTG